MVITEQVCGRSPRAPMSTLRPSNTMTPTKKRSTTKPLFEATSASSSDLCPRYKRSQRPRHPKCSMQHCCVRSEEHTSELQSRGHLVCRLLLEKKKKTSNRLRHHTRKSKF